MFLFELTTAGKAVSRRKLGHAYLIQSISGKWMLMKLGRARPAYPEGQLAVCQSYAFLGRP